MLCINVEDDNIFLAFLSCAEDLKSIKLFGISVRLNKLENKQGFPSSMI